MVKKILTQKPQTRPPLGKQQELEGIRLAEIIRELNIKKSAFAQSIRISNAAISQMCRGQQTIQEYHLLCMEYVHTISQKYIKTGKGEKFFNRPFIKRPPTQDVVKATSTSTSTRTSKPPSTDFYLVPQLNPPSAALSSREKALGKARYAFRIDWLIERGEPKELVLLEVADDKMSPEMNRKDWVLVDVSRKNPSEKDRVVIQQQGHFLVREVQSQGKNLQVVSRDAKESPVLLADLSDSDEKTATTMIGTVVWLARNL